MSSLDEAMDDGVVKVQKEDNFKLNFNIVPPFWSEVNKGTKVDYRHCNLT
jgi:hypothetical protein